MFSLLISLNNNSLFGKSSGFEWVSILSRLMELSKEMGFPPSSGYNPLASAGSGGGGDDHHNIDNGTTVFKPPQIPHHHPLLQQQQELNPQQQSLGQGCDPDPDPDPDPVHVAGVLAGATIASTIGGSNSKASVRYRECLKNHAANIGGNVVDGCGEFMPDGEEGTLEALMCAACNCHRNFHRKEVDGETIGRSLSRTPFNNHHPSHVHGFWDEHRRHRKRFRTKFTQEQKEKMLEYAEKVGWRMQKQYEEQVQQLCAEVGVKRQVFKVWMHNNKNTLKKQPQPQQQPPPLEQAPARTPEQTLSYSPSSSANTKLAMIRSET
ncbi:unnamed protein product, partial [Vitis vinifera]